MKNYNETDIKDSDLEGIDDIIDSVEATETKTPEESDSGVVDMTEIDDDEEYVPVVTRPQVTNSGNSELEAMIDDELEYMASKEPETADLIKSKIIKGTEEFTKSLVANQGFTPIEARNAAFKRATRRAREENDKFRAKNPETVNIKVNKGDADKLVIDPEDMPKVRQSNVINLIEVEDKSLGSIKIKPRNGKTPINIAQMGTCVLSKYTVPCINTVDTCTFAGSSTYNLATNLINDIDSNYEKYSKQIALAYDRFICSKTKNKYGALGNVVMTFEDFANYLAFPDLPACLYAIYVASSTEEIESTIQCTEPECIDINEKEQDPRRRKRPHEFKVKYKCKDLMRLDDIDDKFKELKEKIELCSNADSMEALREDNRRSRRYRSAMTLNIYDVSVPSCARALEFMKLVDVAIDEANEKNEPLTSDDKTMLESYANIAMFIDTVYIFSGEYDENGEPIYYEPITDLKEIFDIVSNVIEPEFQLFYRKLIPGQSCVYSFKLHTECDKCGKEEDRDVDVAYLVFLKATGTEAMIE